MSKMGDFKKRILVTGGAGFIGSHMVLLLVKRHPEFFVVNLDKLDYCASTTHLDSIKDYPNYKFVKGNICQRDFMEYFLNEEKIDVIFHFAAQSHVDLSFWSSLDFTQNNVCGTHVLITAAFQAGIERFIHVSTDEVYGGNSLVALNEGDKMNPTNPYAASKAAAECIVNSYWESFKFPVSIVRSNNVYGPHQYPEKVIPKFISLLKRDRKCCMHGKGEAIRNFVYASDVVEAFYTVLMKGEPGQTYNIGTDYEISMIELAKFFIKKMKGVSRPEEIDEYIEYVDDRPFNDFRYPLDCSKLKSLGWAPKVSWEDGIQKTIDWYLEDKNFESWSFAEKSLSAYPDGSNTIRTTREVKIGKWEQTPRKSNGVPANK